MILGLPVLLLVVAVVVLVVCAMVNKD